MHAPRTEEKVNGLNTYEVTCILEDVDQRHPYFAIYTPSFFTSVYERSDYNVGWSSDNSFVFRVPEGTYDIATYFMDWEEEISCNIVREAVEIKEDTTIAFHQDDATETVALRPILKSGEELKFPSATFLDEEPWIVIDYSKANVRSLFCQYSLFKEGCERINNGALIAEFPDEAPEVKIRTNKLSDKYHLLTLTVLEVNEDEYQLSTTDISGMYTRTVKSYIDGFQKYPMPEFVQTPILKEVGAEPNKSRLYTSMWLENVETAAYYFYTASTSPAVYAACQPSDVMDVKLTIAPGSVQADGTITVEEEWEGEIFEISRPMKGFMYGLPAYYDNGKWQYINQNHSLCGTYVYQIPEDGPILEFPGLQPYCYNSNELNQPLGNSSPILVISTIMRDYEGFIDDEYTIIPGLYFSPEAWIGRWGEVRNIDNLTASILVKNGKGEILFDNKDGELENWLY